jgi:hypothetical protein
MVIRNCYYVPEMNLRFHLNNSLTRAHSNVPTNSMIERFIYDGMAT